MSRSKLRKEQVEAIKKRIQEEFKNKVELLYEEKSKNPKSTYEFFPVTTQTKYAKYLSKNMPEIPNISQPTVSRLLYELGYSVKKGYLVESKGGVESGQKIELSKIFINNSTQYKKVSDSFLFLQSSGTDVFHVKKIIKDLYNDFVLSTLLDDENNLLILCKDSDSTDQFIRILNDEFSVEEIQ